MRPTLFCLLAATVGCVATPKPPLLVPTAFRTAYPDRIWPSLSKAIEAEGFEPALISNSRETHGQSNAEENTERDDLAYVFRTTRDGLSPPLTNPEAASVMGRLKADFRRAVNAVPEGEVLGSREDEAYQERTLVVTYRIDKVNGTASFKWTPFTAEGELVNRLEVVFREQQPPN